MIAEIYRWCRWNIGTWQRKEKRVTRINRLLVSTVGSLIYERHDCGVDKRKKKFEAALTWKRCIVNSRWITSSSIISRSHRDRSPPSKLQTASDQSASLCRDRRSRGLVQRLSDPQGAVHDGVTDSDLWDISMDSIFVCVIRILFSDLKKEREKDFFFPY